MTPTPARLDRLLILIPVYDDWDSLQLLLPAIEAALTAVPGEHRVLVIDDGSTQPPPTTLTGPFHRLSRVDCLTLRRNLGHQRALAVGLCHVWDHIPCDAVLVMDGDGEDAPADIPRLLERYRTEGGTRVVFAERTRRSESWLFRGFYRLYRGAHWVMTGIEVKVGNFSILPRALLGRLVVVSELWNHYAAAVFKAKLPRVGIPTQRATRLHGASQMNFVALVVHGLSAISVFSDLAGVRLLLGFGGIMLFALLALTGMVVMSLATGVAVSGWAALGAIMLCVVLLQAGLFALLACFITLGARHGAVFIPQRDYVHFKDEVVTLYPTDEHVRISG